MSQIWKTVLAIIGSVGGAGAIIAAIVKFCSGMIAERLSQKYEIKMNKELESYKSLLSKKNYISKTRFDMEFSIYGKLCEKFLLMTDKVYYLFPIFDQTPTDEQERKEMYENRYKEALLAIGDARDALGGNAPFIPSEHYDAFEEVLKLCITQSNMYSSYGAPARDNMTPEDRKVSREYYNKTREIDGKFKAIVAKLREYLETLEVTEE